MILLVVIAMLGLMYALINIPIETQISSQQALASAGLTYSTDIVRPLTFIDDPQYAHQYEIRAQYINDRLEQLKNETQADRAYLVTYSDGLSQFGNMKGLKISKTFEVGKNDTRPYIHEFQDFLRVNWLRIKRDEYAMWGGFVSTIPQGFGLEVYDRFGTPIGYLGIDYLQDNPRFRGDEMTVLRRSAGAIKTGLVQNLESVTSLGAP
jgi:hypothetical protein